MRDEGRVAGTQTIHRALSVLSLLRRAASDVGVAADPQEQQENDTVGSAASEPDYLADLQRLQAEFDNYRKRVMREQTALSQRASARLIEHLLPVLDHLGAAIEHGEGGPGVEMVYKDFIKVLSEEGLEEIPAEGCDFDPTVHEAVESVPDNDVETTVVRKVYRRGYRLKDSVLRPAMVVVAHPSDESTEEEQPSEDAAEG